MVAKTPPKTRIMAPLNPNQLRETIKKVDQCMARLQELQYTVSGGTKVISGKNLSPRSTRGYLRTSVRCKQESLRIKNSAGRKSPVGKFQGSAAGAWKHMSLPAMLVGETVGEILQASQFTRDIAGTIGAKPNKIGSDDPKTPMTQRRNQNRNHKTTPENTELRARRKREKQVVSQKVRLESDSPTLQRARSRINFKVSPIKRELGKENLHTAANRISPKNRPWAKKTVLFPNPLFLSTPTSQQHKFCKTRSPLIPRAQPVPHKFLVKSPPSHSKFQVKIKNPPVSLSPTRANILNKKSPTRSPVIPRTQQVPHKFLVKSPPSHSKFQVKIKNPPVSLSPTRANILNKKSPIRSPVIPRTQQVPHKFLVKSPPSHSKFQVKIKIPPVSLSPTRASILKRKSPTRDTILSKKSPTRSTVISKKSPPRVNILNKNAPKVSTATKLRRSLSPAKLASRFVSPLKNRMSIEMGNRFLSGLKQRQTVVY